MWPNTAGVGQTGVMKKALHVGSSVLIVPPQRPNKVTKDTSEE
jgi:hypothetical protein